MATQYTAETIIRAIQAAKGNVSAAARTLGCTRQTLANYVKKYSSVRQALDDEREAMIDTAESALYSAVLDKQGWAVCFTLKTLGRSRGYIERHDVHVTDWRDQAIAKIQAGAIDYAALREVTHDQPGLAEELFAAAGVAVTTGGG
jgi:transposase-like protein